MALSISHSFLLSFIYTDSGDLDMAIVLSDEVSVVTRRTDADARECVCRRIAKVSSCRLRAAACQGKRREQRKGEPSVVGPGKTALSVGAALPFRELDQLAP